MIILGNYFDTRRLLRVFWIFSVGVGCKMKLTMLTRDLRRSERAIYAHFIRITCREQSVSVFFRFELFCLKVDMSVCEARLPYTLSFSSFMRRAPVHAPSPPFRDYLPSAIFNYYLLNPGNWLMKH